VRAATAELERGIAPALSLTWKIFATQAQMDSGALSGESTSANFSISRIFPSMTEE